MTTPAMRMRRVRILWFYTLAALSECTLFQRAVRTHEREAGCGKPQSGSRIALKLHL